MSKNTWYFAYGSNLWKQQMLERTGDIPSSRRALLANYRFCFHQMRGSQNVYANIFPDSGAVVHGVAYLCNDHAMRELDIYEGVAEGCYYRDLLQVATESEERFAAVTYIGGDLFTTEQGQPSESYLNRILTGAREHGLPEDYIGMIESLAKAELRRQ